MRWTFGDEAHLTAKFVGAHIVAGILVGLILELRDGSTITVTPATLDAINDD